MSYPKYQRLKDGVPISPDPPPVKDDVPVSPGPPPYSETEPGLQRSPTGSMHCTEWEESPVTPPPIYSPGRRASGEILPQPKTVVIVPVERNEETIYLPSSFLCCLVPLGAIAFCFSNLAQKARLRGDTAAAQQNTRIATILLCTAIGLGFLIFIFLIFLKFSLH